METNLAVFRGKGIRKIFHRMSGGFPFPMWWKGSRIALIHGIT